MPVSQEYVCVKEITNIKTNVEEGQFHNKDSTLEYHNGKNFLDYKHLIT